MHQLRSKLNKSAVGVLTGEPRTKSTVGVRQRTVDSSSFKNITDKSRVALSSNKQTPKLAAGSNTSAQGLLSDMFRQKLKAICTTDKSRDVSIENIRLLLKIPTKPISLKKTAQAKASQSFNRANTSGGEAYLGGVNGIRLPVTKQVDRNFVRPKGMPPKIEKGYSMCIINTSSNSSGKKIQKTASGLGPKEDISKQEQKKNNGWGDNHPMFDDFDSDVGDERYVNILAMQDEEDDLFGAVEHQVTMIMSNCTLDLNWVKENWDSVIFILNQKFSRIAFLNDFEKVLSLYHFILLNFNELSSQNFNSLISNPPTKPKSSNKTLTSETTMVENLTAVNIQTRDVSKGKRPGLFISEIAKINQKKIIWTNNSRRTSAQKLDDKNSSQVYRPELLRFFDKILLFFFKAIEECVSSPTVNYENLVIQFEYVVTFCANVSNKYKAAIIEAFGKLFIGLDQFGFMMSSEEFAVIAGTYFVVVNQSLKQNVMHYVNRKGSSIEIDFDSFSLEECLDRILKKHKQRAAIINHVSFKLILHFEALRELLIALPAHMNVLRVSAYSSIFIICKYPETFNLLRKKLSARIDVREVYQAMYLQMLDTIGNEAINQCSTMQIGLDKPDIIKFVERIIYMLVHLERHMQQQILFDSQAHILLDQTMVKETLMFIQRMLKIAFSKPKKDITLMMELCIKFVSIFIYFLSSMIVSSNRPDRLLSYSFMVPHLNHFSLLIKQSKRILVPKAIELLQLMQSLAGMIGQVEQQV